MINKNVLFYCIVQGRKLEKYSIHCQRQIQERTLLDFTVLSKQNKQFERHIFRCCAQQEAESIDSYVTCLRTLVRTCKFHSVDEELITQINEKCSPNKLQRKLPEEPNLTLPEVIQIAQSAEIISRQIKEYETTQTAAINTSYPSTHVNPVSLCHHCINNLHSQSRPEPATVVEVVITQQMCMRSPRVRPATTVAALDTSAKSLSILQEADTRQRPTQDWSSLNLH